MNYYLLGMATWLHEVRLSELVYIYHYDNKIEVENSEDQDN